MYKRSSLFWIYKRGRCSSYSLKVKKERKIPADIIVIAKPAMSKRVSPIYQRRSTSGVLCHLDAGENSWKICKNLNYIKQLILLNCFQKI